jgi:hypothetical protein
MLGPRVQYQVALADGIMRDREFEHAVEDHAAAARASAIDAIEELVEEALEVRLLHAPLLGAKQPALPDRGDTMHARQQVRSLRVEHHDTLVEYRRSVAVRYRRDGTEDHFCPVRPDPPADAEHRLDMARTLAIPSSPAPSAANPCRGLDDGSTSFAHNPKGSVDRAVREAVQQRGPRSDAPEQL